MCKLNEKRIELPNPYPVGKKEIIDLVERSTRLVHTATDDKTIQLYIYSNGSERPEAFAEVEITSVGYILHGAEGYDYQGSSMKEFDDDLRDVVFHYDAITSKRFGENNTINKEKLFESLLNEDGLFKPFAGFALTMAALTALGIQTKNFDEKCKAIADELGVKLDENAFDQHGAGYYMPYLQSFKYDGGSKDYGMTPEGLCEYIKKTADVTRVNYEKVEGGVKISFLDKYLVNVGKVISRKEAIGSFIVPDSYFDVSFIFQESKNKLFDSILNETSLKEFFFYAPPHNEENEEDSIIGYIAAVRDYQTQKTKYVDDNGNVCNSKSQAKVFDTKGKADNYSYDHCPEGWTHFVVALKKSDILNEAETTKYMACCYDPEDYYEETNYIDEDGELSCNSSGAKLFNTEDEAIEYADENKPIGWMSFAMPFNTTLNEADDTYKAKVQGKWLKGNKLVKDKKDADTFESKTEPTQRINQMKKDGKLNKNTKSNIVKESINNKNQLFESLLQEVK